MFQLKANLCIREIPKNMQMNSDLKYTSTKYFSSQVLEWNFKLIKKRIHFGAIYKSVCYNQVSPSSQQ